MARVQVFASADRRARRVLHFLERGDVFSRNRIFQPHQIQRFKGVGNLENVVRSVRPVGVDEQIRVGVQRLAERRDHFDVEGDVAVAHGAVVVVAPVGARVNVELDGVKAAGFHFLGLGYPRFGIVVLVAGVAVVVHAN